MSPDRFVFAHMADAHVGAWPRDAAIRKALRESVLRALQAVEDRNCQFLLISGDLFHTPVPEPAEVAPVAAALRRLTEQGRRVYVIYGSHDYVAHRTSWLDVLAETGIFLRAAPEAIRAEGDRWTLPFVIDRETGAAIAGISGRSHGLDRSYFAAVDSEAFRSHPGFRIFQFHAAVEEYLPEGLREHIHGIRVQDLPGQCDYYAGGHIHRTYIGEGPDGGLLVNPGAVFGTSITDLHNAQQGNTRQGVVIVTVVDGVPSHEFVDTVPAGGIRVFDVDVSGKTAEEARAEVARAIDEQAAPGTHLFPRVHGSLIDGGVAALGLPELVVEANALGVGSVHWDVSEVYRPQESPVAAVESDVEAEGLARLAEAAGSSLSVPQGDDRENLLKELLKELGTARTDGEAKQDYELARVDGALTLLGVKKRRSAT